MGFVYSVYSRNLYDWIIIVISKDLTPVFAPRQQHFMNWRPMCTVTLGASAWSGGIMGKIGHLWSITGWYFTNWVDHRLIGSRNIHAMVLRFAIFYLLSDFTVIIAAPSPGKYRLWFYFSMISVKLSLTHWGRDKMDAIWQTTFSSAFSWLKMFEFRLKFHWSLFLRVQLTIS